MAPNRIPPPPSLSEDENEELLLSSDDEEAIEDTSSDDDQEQEDKDDQEEDEEDDEEEQESSESESGESPRSPNASDFTIMPIASKPMVREAKKENLKKSNAAAPAPAPAEKRAVAKRALDQVGSDDSNLKRCKVSNKKSEASVGGESKEKKSGANRLWSEDDEIAILQGLIDFKLTKGVDPYADMGVFYEFEKERLSVSVSNRQLMDKIRRLKLKFRANVQKSGEDADMGAFSKVHDVKCFELSKKIWGKGVEVIDVSGKSNKGQGKKSGGKGNSSNVGVAKVKAVEKVIVSKEKEKDTDEIKVAPGDFAKAYPYLNSAMEVQLETGPFQALSEEDRRVMKEKIRGNEKASDLNEKFKILKLKEVQLYSEKLELMKETTGMFLGALKAEE